VRTRNPHTCDEPPVGLGAGRGIPRDRHSTYSAASEAGHAGRNSPGGVFFWRSSAGVSGKKKHGKLNKTEALKSVAGAPVCKTMGIRRRKSGVKNVSKTASLKKNHIAVQVKGKEIAAKCEKYAMI